MSSPDEVVDGLRARRARGRLPGTPRVFGRSRLGAPLEVFEPEGQRTSGGVLVMAGTHGEEPESVVVLSAALRMLERSALRVPVVLALNPDGLARGTRGNAAGVDLNRNLPCSTWSPETVRHRWATDQPRDVELSPGEAPGSEPETRALLELLDTHRPATLLSVHAPLGWIDDPAPTPLGRRLAVRSGLPLVGDPGYATPGSLGTWGAEHGVAVITYELPHASMEILVREHAPLLLDVLRGRA